jgi:osmotically-inducible protein OsmY
MRAANHRYHRNFNFHFSVMLLAIAVATLTAACASTPTSESTGGYVDDSTITAKVKTDLATDSNTSATSIHVETYKGVVDLSGFVNTRAEAAEAARVAGQASGVKAVHNNLIVKTIAAPPTAAEKRND